MSLDGQSTGNTPAASPALDANLQQAIATAVSTAIAQTNASLTKTMNELKAGLGRLHSTTAQPPTQSQPARPGAGAPSAVAGAETDYVDLLESNPQMFMQQTAQFVFGQFEPYLNAQANLLLNNSEALSLFLTEPGKEYRRQKVYRDNLKSKLSHIYAADPQLSLDDALLAAEAKVVEDLQTMGYLSNPETPVGQPTQGIPGVGLSPAAPQPPTVATQQPTLQPRPVNQPGAVADGGNTVLAPGRPAHRSGAILPSDEQQIDDYVADVGAANTLGKAGSGQ